MAKDKNKKSLDLSSTKPVKTANNVISFEKFKKTDQAKRAHDKLRENIKFAESQIDW